MTDRDDELLAGYAREGSDAAFTALVTRHVNLVYATARRLAGNPAHAEEITQAVFIILARKAGGLRRGTILPAWLYQTTRFTAANFMKGERRRQHREQEAVMQSTLHEPERVAWEQLTPLLDEAMGRLAEGDRSALVLRFFEGKTLQEVGAKLNLSESAAHKRVSRALEKLRGIFTKRGVTLPAAMIAAAVGANSVQAAPAEVGASVAAGALGKAASAGALQWVVGATLRQMLWLKLQPAVLTVIGLSLVGGAGVLSWQARSPSYSARARLQAPVVTNAAPPAASNQTAITIRLEGTPGLAYEVSYSTDGPPQTVKGVLPGQVSFKADGFQAAITVQGSGEFAFEVYRGKLAQVSKPTSRISGTTRFAIAGKKGGAVSFSESLSNPIRSGKVTLRPLPTTNTAELAAFRALREGPIKIKLAGTPGLAYEVSYSADGTLQTAKGLLPGEVSFKADDFKATITAQGPGEFGFEVYRGELFLTTARVARINGTRSHVIEARKGLGGGVSLRSLPYK